jgi:UDP-N-acetylmuramate--alanine ligase
MKVAEGVDGPVLAGIDDPGARRLASRTKAITYGTSPDAHWTIDAVEHGEWDVRFRLRGRAADLRVTVPRPGLHVARNAAGVLALLGELGVDVAAAAAGLASFSGVRRRFEVRARLGGVTVVDDYAHHPTELSATLAAARLGSWRRVWAVFQPHRYSRTAQLAVSLGSALAPADRVVVADVYGAGEPPQPGITGRLVADAARAAGAEDVEYVPRRSHLARHVADRAAPGDLVLVLGAGDVTRVAEELAEMLGEAT